MTKASLAPLDAPESVQMGVAAGNGMLSAVKKYFQLAKPGIVMGNLVSAIGGFLLAARGQVDAWLFIDTMVAISLVVASGCVFNNYIDRDIDVKMRRTQKRALVQGLVSPRAALIYGAILGLAGAGLLYYAANVLSVALVIFGFAIYVGVYSLYLKRHSVLQTLIGSLSGAMPPVVGYCAVTGRFDLGAALLLLAFSLWQMPHSYAIAIVYRDDYAAAGVPVLPVKLGVGAAKKRILFYIPFFTAAALLLAVCGYTGWGYFTVIAVIGTYWLYAAIKGYRTLDDRAWARKMFLFSIVSVMALSVMMSVDFRALPPSGF